MTLWISAVTACGSVQSSPPGTDAAPADAAPGSLVPSCAGIPANRTCGAGGNDDCCASLIVVGGSFDRSYDVAGDASSGNTGSPATVSNFRLDKYEVTVGRFRAFVSAGMGTQAQAPATGTGAHAQIVGSGWSPSWTANLASDTTALIAQLKCSTSNATTWTDAPGTNEDRPINCLSWYEAMAFCVWDGGYLPTDAEWNYAAAGGKQQRAYPWSDPAGTVTSLDASHASYQVGNDCVGDGMPGCAFTDLVPVGSKPAGVGLFGQFDLAGNVYEWTLDYDLSYAVPCTDCANLTPPSTGTVTRVRRGGSFTVDATALRTGIRNPLAPTMLFDGSGVRCARPQ